jgi:predicted esterase
MMTTAINLSVVAIAATMWLMPSAATAKPCDSPDDPGRVTGVGECLVIQAFPSPGELSRPTLVVVLHGDLSAGGPAKYHFAFAQALAEAPGAQNLVAVAMVRPGYEDGAGNASTGENFQRNDHYTADNIDAVADAVRRLKERYQAGRVVLVGHSGGAATAAVILGRHPGVADAAVLVSCPCNIGEWRQTRRGPWTRSESPHDWANKVPEAARVVALTGTDDSNTRPALAEQYVDILRKRGVDARFVAVLRAGHDSAFRSPKVVEAVAGLVH